MKIGWVAPVKPSHPYLENDPAPLFDLHYLRISPWLWFSSGVRGRLFAGAQSDNEKALSKLSPLDKCHYSHGPRLL